MDIYYDMTKINGFRKKCIEKQAIIVNRLTEYDTRLKESKVNIRNYRSRVQDRYKYVKEKLTSDFNTKLKAIASEAFCRLETLHKSSICFILVYSCFRESMRALSISNLANKDENLGKLIMDQDKLTEKLMISGEDTSFYTSLMKDVEDIYLECKDIRKENEQDVINSSREISKHINNISNIYQSVKEFSTGDFKKMISDFSDLSKVTRVKEAYEHSISEISRRNDFHERFFETFKELSQAIKSENKMREAFLSRYATVLPDSFVPELKNVLPELPPEEAVLSVDKNLPPISGLHNEAEVKITKRDGFRFEVAQKSDDQILALKKEIETLLAERKESKLKQANYELKIDGLRTQIEVQKERSEALNYIESQNTMIGTHTYYGLLDTSSSQSEKKNLLGDLLKSNAKQVYKFFAPILASKNSEVKELKKELLENKLHYERNIEEQTRNYDVRIKDYLDTIESFRSKEDEAKQKLHRMKAESEDKQREINNLRNSNNSYKQALEEKDKKMLKLEKESIEFKSQQQMIQSRYEQLQRSLQDNKSKDNELKDEKLRFVRERDQLSSELDSTRQKVKKAEEEIIKLKLELAIKSKNEANKRKASSSEIPEGSVGSRDLHDSGKRQLLTEIEKKNTELSTLYSEMKKKSEQVETLNKSISDLQIQNEDLLNRLKKVEKEYNSLKESSPHYSRSNSSRRELGSLKSIRGSSRGDVDSPRASLAMAHKEEELSALQKANSLLKQQLEDKTNRLQTLLKCMSDNEQSLTDKGSEILEKDDFILSLKQDLAQLKMEVGEKDALIKALREEVDQEKRNYERKEEGLEQKFSGVEQKYDKILKDKSDLLTKLTDMETHVRNLQEELQQKERGSQHLNEEYQTLELSLKQSQNEVQEKIREIEYLTSHLETLKMQTTQANTKVEQLESINSEKNLAVRELEKQKVISQRYMSLSSSLYFHSVKCDRVYKGGISIFVRYSRSIYIPLVFNYQKDLPEVEELTREAATDILDHYLIKLKQFQKQINSVTFVLDLSTLPQNIRSILESNSMVIVCRVSDVIKEPIDLKTNKNLVSFVTGGTVYKVEVDDVLSLFSASYENQLSMTDSLLLQTGNQFRSFNN